MMDFLTSPFTWFLWAVTAGALLKAAFHLGQMVVNIRRADEARCEIDLLRLDSEFQNQHETNLLRRYRAINRNPQGS